MNVYALSTQHTRWFQLKGLGTEQNSSLSFNQEKSYGLTYKGASRTLPREGPRSGYSRGQLYGEDQGEAAFKCPQDAQPIGCELSDSPEEAGASSFGTLLTQHITRTVPSTACYKSHCLMVNTCASPLAKFRACILQPSQPCEGGSILYR